MRILISAYACDPTRGSESGNGWNRVVSNAVHGNDVVCLTTSGARQEKNINDRLEMLGFTNVRFVFVPVPDWVEKSYRYEAGVYFHYLVWQHLAYKAAKKLLKTESFDLIHHITYGSIHMGSELWKLKIPFVYGPLGGGQLAPESFKKYFYRWWRSEVKRKWMRKILLLSPNTRGAIKNSAILLATNEETYELAKRYNPRKLRLFPDTTLPDSFFPDSLPEKDFTKRELKIFWIGRIFAFKGLNVILEALSKTKVPFKLTIVGHGPLSEYIPEWVKQYNLEGKVDYLGKLPWDQVKEAYLKNDVFMYCSLRDSSAVQYVEAMALGLPVITLDLHGSRTLVPDEAGIKVKVTDPESTTDRLAEAVEYMYENPDKRREFSAFAFNHARNFMESNNAQRFFEIYNEVLRTSGKAIKARGKDTVPTW